VTNDVHAAIEKEKRIKGWLQRKKIALIEAMNPQWTDLSEGWFREVTLSDSEGSQILRSAQNDKE